MIVIYMKAVLSDRMLAACDQPLVFVQPKIIYKIFSLKLSRSGQKEILKVFIKHSV
jgi:hypothetical protein